MKSSPFFWIFQSINKKVEMASIKKYGKSVEELKDSSVVETLSKNEVVEHIPTDDCLGDKETLETSSTARRDCVKYVGCTTAAAS